MRLDRYLSKTLRQSNKQVKFWLENHQILLNDAPCTLGATLVNRFSRIQVDGKLLPHDTPTYLIMNKPAGVLSATDDRQHTTVIDLIKIQYPQLDTCDIHLAGRLDRATTGLLLLTNDGRWSKALTRPEQKIPKTYLVTTERPIPRDAVARFAEGVHFEKEGVTTSPAQLQLLGETQARLTIFEGMHHQVKRMFALYHNPVIALHRERMGRIMLESTLAEGQCRRLRQEEISHFGDPMDESRQDACPL